MHGGGTHCWGCHPFARAVRRLGCYGGLGSGRRGRIGLPAPPYLRRPHVSSCGLGAPCLLDLPSRASAGRRPLWRRCASAAGTGAIVGSSRSGCDASPARRFARRVAPLHDASQARSGASHEVWFPSTLASHAVQPDVPSRAIPLRRWAAWVNRLDRPGPLASPLRFSCRAPAAGPNCPARSALRLRAPPAVGHSPRDSSAVRRTGPTSGLSWPGRFLRAIVPDLDLPVRVRLCARVSGGAPGIFTLRSVAPAHGCWAVTGPRTHLPFRETPPR